MRLWLLLLVALLAASAQAKPRLFKRQAVDETEGTPDIAEPTQGEDGAEAGEQEAPEAGDELGAADGVEGVPPEDGVEAVVAEETGGEEPAAPAVDGEESEGEASGTEPEATEGEADEAPQEPEAGETPEVPDQPEPVVSDSLLEQAAAEATNEEVAAPAEAEQEAVAEAPEAVDVGEAAESQGAPDASAAVDVEPEVATEEAGSSGAEAEVTAPESETETPEITVEAPAPPGAEEALEKAAAEEEKDDNIPDDGAAASGNDAADEPPQEPSMAEPEITSQNAEPVPEGINKDEPVPEKTTPVAPGEPYTDDFGWTHYPWKHYQIFAKRFIQVKKCGCKVKWVKRVYNRPRCHFHPKTVLAYEKSYGFRRPVHICKRHRRPACGCGIPHHHHVKPIVRRVVVNHIHPRPCGCTKKYVVRHPTKVHHVDHRRKPCNHRFGNTGYDSYLQGHLRR